MDKWRPRVGASAFIRPQSLSKHHRPESDKPMSTPIAEDLASDALQQFHAELRLALLMQHQVRLQLLFRQQFPNSHTLPFEVSAGPDGPDGPDWLQGLALTTWLTAPPPAPIAAHGAFQRLLRAQDRLMARARETLAAVDAGGPGADQVAELLRDMQGFAGLAERLAAGITASLTEIDELTGLFNRLAMERDLAREQAQARRTGAHFTVAMIDADHFKRVNDRFGHPFGDLVLESLAERFVASLRPRDSVYRFGGEEFLVILPATRLDAARVVLERLRMQARARDIGDDEARITQTVSIGAVEVTAQDDLDAALERADAALYRAKQAGRDRIALARAA